MQAFARSGIPLIVYRTCCKVVYIHTGTHPRATRRILWVAGAGTAELKHSGDGPRSRVSYLGTTIHAKVHIDGMPTQNLCSTVLSEFGEHDLK